MLFSFHTAAQQSSPAASLWWDDNDLIGYCSVTSSEVEVSVLVPLSKCFKQNPVLPQRLWFATRNENTQMKILRLCEYLAYTF